MIPVLYPKNETAFTNQGYGALSDAISCVVTEELNGEYELQMTYPVTGKRFGDIILSGIILAEPADDEAPQPFRIYKISKPLKGVVTVDAQHISYQACHIPVLPFTANSASAAMSALISNAVGTCPFSVYTNVTKSGKYKHEYPSSMRDCIGGETESILTKYGGELKWDFYTINLLNHRGTNRNVVLRYGKNVRDLEQESNLEEVITGIVPYYKKTDDTLLTVSGYVVNGSHVAQYPYPRTVALDMTSEFEEEPTAAQLLAKAQSYVADASVGVPKVSISVNFVALWQTEEYAAIKALERVKLGDTVGVYFAELGINTSAEVVRTEYDVLHSRYNNIEVGDPKSNLASTLYRMFQQQ